MIRCQIETTMPFHDYWYVPPKLTPISTIGLALIPGAGVAMLVASLVAWILRWTGPAWTAAFSG